MGHSCGQNQLYLSRHGVKSVNDRESIPYEAAFLSDEPPTDYDLGPHG